MWISRFEAIMRRYGWIENDKCDQVLPRIQDTAGQVVFGQLPRRIKENYSILVAELHSRYRVVCTSWSYAAEIGKRNHEEGEDTEKCAAELNKLNDKAHGHRDRRTKQKDLVRKFLESLIVDEVCFVVEYQKNWRT